MPYEPDSVSFQYKKIGKERLYFCLPPNHKYAHNESLSMADMDGENMLLFQEIGFWRDIVDAKMPHSKFLIQTERYSLEELITNTILPCFSSSMTITSNDSNPGNRVNIPITDPEADVTYYLTCKKENKDRFLALFR